MTIYACVDSKELIEIETECEIPNQSDREIDGKSYRRLDETFLAWIVNRVQTALRSRHANEEELGSAVLFAIDCQSILGYPARLPDVPAGYTKPDIAERFAWAKEIEWEAEPRAKSKFKF